MMDTFSDDEEEKHDAVNNLSVARFEGIQCSICDAGLELKLYFCKHDGCQGKIYCVDCGLFRHGRKKRNYHPFDPVEINEIVEPRESCDDTQYGKQQLIDLLGIIRFNKIKPLIDKSVSTVQVSMPIAQTIANEVQMLLAHADKVVQAAKSTNAAWIAKNAYDASADLVRLQSLYEADLVRLQSLYEADAFAMFRKIYRKLLPCQMELFEKQMDLVRQQTQAIENVKKAVRAVKEASAGAANQSVNAATKSLTNGVKTSAVVVAVTTAMECAYHSSRYYRDEISGIEWVRLTGKALTRNAASAAGSSFGAVAGAGAAVEIATYGFSAGVATTTGLGLGIVGGFLLGYYCGKGAEEIYEHFFPPQEELAKKRLLHDALLYFRFEENDLTKPAIFNEKRLKKEFKSAALGAHPDRQGGSEEKWHKLSIHYGVLRACLDQNNESKQLIQDDGQLQPLNFQ